MNEPVSIRLPPQSKERADKLIHYLRSYYPHLPKITRQTVLREALLRGLADMEHVARAKDMLE